MTDVRARVPALAMCTCLVVLATACGNSATHPLSGATVRHNATSRSATTVANSSPSTTRSPTSTTTPGVHPSSTTTSNPFLRGPGDIAFVTPSGNINCDLGYLQSGTGNAAFCETLSPPQSATLSSTGSVKTCGLACEGNAEEGTPTLAYGGQTGIGPFQCRSAQSGVTCTASGQGFEISSSGIAPVGTPSVDLAPGSYNGTVETVSADVSEMTYNITSSRCGAVASSGTWTVDLAGASFVSNSEPSSGQGESVTVTPAQWQQEEQNQHSWTVVVVSGQPLEVTDGPSC